MCACAVNLLQRSTYSFYRSISQKNMTTPDTQNTTPVCPAETLIKMLSGKWKPQIFRLATTQSLRFNTLLRQLEGANKQSLAIALREMEQDGLLEKTVIRLKPLHIEYRFSEKGRSMVSVFELLEQL